MRLWHIDLIPYLPKSQLLAQWRELNSIFKKQDKHILINYIYGYDKIFLLNYTLAVINEMEQTRNYNITKFDNFNNYFQNMQPIKYSSSLKFREHNKEYLTICYYNLKEKYMRGQKDFTKEAWEKLDKFYKKEISNGKNSVHGSDK